MDWIVHLLVPWIGAKILQVRCTEMADRQIALVMLGAVLPDINAIGYLLQWTGINYGGFLLPFHTPIGSLLVAAIISLMFTKRKQALSILGIGIATHYALDSLLLHVGGGMVLLFPFNWIWDYQLGLFSSNNWVPFIVTAMVAVMLLATLQKKRSRSHHT